MIRKFFSAKIKATLLLYFCKFFIFLLDHFHFFLHFFFTFMENHFKIHPIPHTWFSFQDSGSKRGRKHRRAIEYGKGKFTNKALRKQKSEQFDQTIEGPLLKSRISSNSVQNNKEIFTMKRLKRLSNP